MRVWYGYSKLTKKIMRKHELAIFFENAYSWKNDDWVRRRIHVVYERNQTKQEIADSKHSTRMFTKYGMFIDKKPYYGDIDRVLTANFEADKNHVSLKEREEIRTKLRKAYFWVYNITEKTKGQLLLNL